MGSSSCNWEGLKYSFIEHCHNGQSIVKILVKTSVDKIDWWKGEGQARLWNRAHSTQFQIRYYTLQLHKHLRPTSLRHQKYTIQPSHDAWRSHEAWYPILVFRTFENSRTQYFGSYYPVATLFLICCFAAPPVTANGYIFHLNGWRKENKHGTTSPPSSAITIIHDRCIIGINIINNIIVINLRHSRRLPRRRTPSFPIRKA